MRVFVPKETRDGERRVALVPSVIATLAKAGFEVEVESGAGVQAGFTDAAYVEAGGSLVEGPGAGTAAVVRVSPPSFAGVGSDEVASIPAGSVLISHLDPLGQTDLTEHLATSGVTAFAMESVPRITRAQKMDALSSQATVAGYRAALMGAMELGRFLPMLMTAAGTIRPSKVLVLGAGVAGLQAIATSRRLGAIVEAFDVRPAVKEQVQSLGATFLEAELDASAEDAGGYARALSEDQHQKELDLIASHLPAVDVVISTAQIPGRPAPRLITRDMVETMKPGSVIIDLASESGGNCEVTRSGESVNHAGVLVFGPVNLPSTLPYHASEMYARNVVAFLTHLAPHGEIVLDFDDEITSGACLTHEGQVTNARVREKLGLPALALAGATPLSPSPPE